MAIDIDLSMTVGYSHIQALELELEKHQKNYSLTCEQENSRRVRVDLLLLQDENVELQAQLLEKEERVDALEEDLEEQCASLVNLNISMNNLRQELRMKMKEADRLKAEVNTLQVLSTESAKLVEEKLALAREVNSMRPEIEHLRAQQLANGNVLCEKLALQRELQTVQVELENEKRAVQKALSKDEGRSSHESKLEAEAESYKNSLAKEQSLREKLEREINKNKGHHDLQHASNESKLEEYRAKLKSAKEQIKSTRAELDEARKANERLSQQTQKISQPSRGKRSHTYMDADGTIGTPDGFPPKKNAQFLLGEKSGFGLTPFLKQSTKLIIETPKNDGEDEEAPVEEASDATAEPVQVQAKKVNSVRPAATSKTKQIKPLKTGNVRKADHWEEVIEEDESGKEKLASPVAALAKEASAKDPVPRKKRRMLGNGPGKTLFDDDDHVTGKIDSRGGLDDFKFAMPKKVTLAPKGATTLAAKSKAGVMSGFGAFSPLKKDRKK